MMEITLEKETALIEAILYLESDPLNEDNLSRISGLSRDAVKKALENLSERYKAADSGLELARIGGGVLISPKKEYWDNLKERYGKKNEARLSRTAMETLAIIAYSQPITRMEVERIRGVTNADAVFHLLKERNLIQKAGTKDVPGSPVQYRTTKDFLKLFRLNSIDDLPKLEESEAERFELEGE
jgi:segregation and condensation protein B